MTYVEELGAKAKKAAKFLAVADTSLKNSAISAMAKALCDNADDIIAANRLDLEKADENGISKVMQDRLRLDRKRIDGIADGLEALVRLDDPVGVVDHGIRRPNGMEITRVRVPMGVIGIIYESRPNVTADAGALCLKAGNAVILRGGKEAYNSNMAYAAYAMMPPKAGMPADVIQLVDDTTRESTNELMKCSKYVDLLIPRGNKGLISAVKQNATVPVIETGTGNCHIYIHESADPDMAVNITDNGKTQRPSVCNALESLLIHKNAAEKLLPLIKARLDEHNVEIRGCEETRRILGDCVVPATDEDYATEFLDYIISVKVVNDIDEAIAHIAEYSTGHSECIVTNSLDNANKFRREVDSACVYVNCSTRFTDGGEFGFGAEIGISTQKMHARGPMGLRELTSTKYLINGSGQIRG